MELYEASRYGLLERIPTLLTSVSVDAADAVSIQFLKWLTAAKANPYLYVHPAEEHLQDLNVLHHYCCLCYVQRIHFDNVAVCLYVVDPPPPPKNKG